MVLFTYLLLGLSARDALQSVLAPVDPGLVSAAGTASGVASGPVEADRGDSKARPLVVPGADAIDLLGEIESQLVARLSPPGELRLIPLADLPRLPRARPLPEVILLDHPSRLTSSTALVRFQLQDGDSILGIHAVTFRVQLIAQAWTPSRRMAAGEGLFDGDVEAREVDLIREPRAVMADPEVFGCYELTRSVNADRTLTWSDLMPRALVHKGQLVEVVADDGLLSITMKGQATRSGALGEVVTVRNLESRREFSAEVVDENKVRVHF